MRKVYDPKTYAHIYSPEKLTKEPFAMVEIGKAEFPSGYVFTATQKNVTYLHYVISGSFYYKGTQYNAPATIVMFSGSKQGFSIDESCNDFCAYWIKGSGELFDTVLQNAEIPFESNALPCDHIEKAIEIFNELTDESSYASQNDTLFMLSGIFRLLSLYSGSQPRAEISSVSLYTQSILEHIHAHYSEQLTEKDLSSIVNLSTNYMHKIFLSDMKLTPIYYLNFYRIKQAKKLLGETDLSIACIADEVGISGGDYFCRVFRKYTGGISPTEYRKKARHRIIRNN